MSFITAYKFFDKKEKIMSTYCHEGDFKSCNRFIYKDIESIAKFCIHNKYRIFKVVVILQEPIIYEANPVVPGFRILIQVLREVFPSGEFSDEFYKYFSLKNGKLHRDDDKPALIYKNKVGEVRGYYKGGVEYKTEYPIHEL